LGIPLPFIFAKLLVPFSIGNGVKDSAILWPP
jgi:hypothetical protein